MPFIQCLNPENLWIRSTLKTYWSKALCSNWNQDNCISSKSRLFILLQRFCIWTTARLVRNKGPCKWNDWRYEKQLTLQVSVSFMKTHSVQWGKNIERLKFERWHGKWSFTCSVIYTIELLVNVLRQMVREPRHTCLLFPFIIKLCWHICMYFTRQRVL